VVTIGQRPADEQHGRLGIGRTAAAEQNPP
jgi:hypothetical protein